MFSRNLFTGIPTHKLTIFISLALILFGSDGFFVLSIPFAFLGKSLLYMVSAWYGASVIISLVVNKRNQIGQINKRAILITGKETFLSINFRLLRCLPTHLNVCLTQAAIKDSVI